MTPQTIAPPYLDDGVRAWAARYVRTPAKAAAGLAYLEKQRALMAAAVADYDAMIAAPSTRMSVGDLVARRRLADIELTRYTTKAAALADALKTAVVCKRCGRPLFDKTQPGYADGVGPECYRKDTP